MQVVLDRENQFSQRVCRARVGGQARALSGMHMGARAVAVATCGAMDIIPPATSLEPPTGSSA